MWFIRSIKHFVEKKLKEREIRQVDATRGESKNGEDKKQIFVCQLISFKSNHCFQLQETNDLDGNLTKKKENDREHKVFKVCQWGGVVGTVDKSEPWR